MYPPEENLRSGYLQQNFRLFHLKDKKEQQFDFHYHDFDKIVIFLFWDMCVFVDDSAIFRCSGLRFPKHTVDLL